MNLALPDLIVIAGIATVIVTLLVGGWRAESGRCPVHPWSIGPWNHRFMGESQEHKRPSNELDLGAARK